MRKEPTLGDKLMSYLDVCKLINENNIHRGSFFAYEVSDVDSRLTAAWRDIESRVRALETRALQPTKSPRKRFNIEPSWGNQRGTCTITEDDPSVPGVSTGCQSVWNNLSHEDATRWCAILNRLVGS